MKCFSLGQLFDRLTNQNKNMEHQSNTNLSSFKPEERFLQSFCHLVDFPNNGIACSISDPNRCVQCPIRGSYFTGESINNYQSWALMYYYITGIITVLISTVGIISNILIVKVFLRINKKETQQRSFDFLLVVLACFDLFCSTMSIITATGFMSYFGNWTGRGIVSIYWCFVSLYMLGFGRSVSTYITILITIERCLMITFPLKSSIWLTQRKTSLMAFGTFLLAVLINYPRFASWRVEKNDWKDLEPFRELEYVVRPTAEGKFWYQKLHAIHNDIDFWMPLPTLLFFNLISFIKVRQLSKRRQEMNMKQKRDIRAVRMFLPIVLAYFVTNIEPMVMIFVIVLHRISYRELYMFMFLAIAVNSVVNLPIYYSRNLSFKEGVNMELEELMIKLGWRKREHMGKFQHGGGKNEEMGIGTSDSGFEAGCDVTEGHSIYVIISCNSSEL